jgi:hypothetical protein
MRLTSLGNDDRSLPSGSGPSVRVFVIGQAPQVGRREVDPPLDPAGNGFFLQRALAQRCPSATPYWSNSSPRSICDACQPTSAASTFRPRAVNGGGERHRVARGIRGRGSRMRTHDEKRHRRAGRRVRTPCARRRGSRRDI